MKVFSKSAAAEANRRMQSPDRERQISRKRKLSRSRSRSPNGREPRSTGLQQQLNLVKQKRQKAMTRQMKYEKRLRATRGERGILEDHSVKEPQRRDYARRLNGFYGFIARFDLPIGAEAELDVALVDYADLLYLNGEASDAGTKLKAALEYHRPEAARSGTLHLPRFKRSLKGWRKLAPNQTRLPMVEHVKSAISGVMLHQGWPEMALFNELTFSTYARPGELMKARVCDVVGKLKKEDNDIIILAPFERGEESKTGIFDEVLILDDKRLSSLGPLTVGMAAKKEKKQGPQADLWDFNAKKYLEVWRSCVAALGAEELAKSPYQNRHGGASRDHLQGVRSVQAIQRRGRWAADSSARIYDKPGRLQQILNKMPRNLETFGEQVRLNFAEYFQGGTFQLPKEVRKRVLACFKA